MCNLLFKILFVHLGGFLGCDNQRYSTGQRLDPVLEMEVEGKCGYKTNKGSWLQTVETS